MEGGSADAVAKSEEAVATVDAETATAEEAATEEAVEEKPQ